MYIIYEYDTYKLLMFVQPTNVPLAPKENRRNKAFKTTPE